MSQPPEKDAIDLAIDFFFGAIFSGVAGGFFYLKTGAWHFTFETFCVIIVTWAMMGGALAAMYRDVFWSAYERYTVIPPLCERVSLRARAILWSVFGLSLALLVLYVVLSPGPVRHHRTRTSPSGESTQ